MTAPPIRLALVVHNHQPVGNFEHVFEQSYHDSYRPFLDVFDRFPSIRISLHTSGSLMEWLAEAHPEYVERLAHLVAQRRIEIIGGPFYEPILSMIPSRDRIGQIRSYTQWLESRLGATVRGMWIPERVWEQSFVRDIAAAGIDYTLVDDFHFKNAGLVESQLYGSYLTEDDGRTMTVFPGSERLRYLIPFADPSHTIDYLAQVAAERPGAIVVFGDDGEKFGTWPDTKKHVYEDRWLERFFEALVSNQEWIRTSTLAEAVHEAAPVGKIYLPDSSYREMTEWALPAAQQAEYDRMVRAMEHDERWPLTKRFVRGGFWRNFKVKYPESDEMYSRMMAVSRRLARAAEDGWRGELIDDARTELYRGQCNCSYWHGAFGGIYLPHLRNAVYRHLIAADKLLDKATRPAAVWVEAKAEDCNFDGIPEVQLANDRLTALFAPGRGGWMYELDVHEIRLNLLATLARREEVYHRKVLAGASAGQEHCASIHDRVVFKQEGLDQRVHYDRHLRKSLLDHFYDLDVSHDAIPRGEVPERGDFLEAAYEARVRRNPDRTQILMIREGFACGAPIRLTKAVTLAAGAASLEITYLLEGLPKDQTFHFGVEFNFAGLPAGADDRYFHDLEGHRHGQLGSRLNLVDASALGLVDEWLGIDVGLRLSRPSGIWTFPIESVNGSESGFELVHQSVVVEPHWHVTADAHGAWNVTMTLSLDTSLAESRREQAFEVAAGA
jgi:hypothetical protein